MPKSIAPTRKSRNARTPLRGVLSVPASRKLLARAGTGYYTMHLGVNYPVARRRFTAEQLLANGESLVRLRRQGAPARDLKKFYSKEAITRASQRVAAEKRRRARR